MSSVGASRPGRCVCELIARLLTGLSAAAIVLMLPTDAAQAQSCVSVLTPPPPAITANHSNQIIDVTTPYLVSNDGLPGCDPLPAPS